MSATGADGSCVRQDLGIAYTGREGMRHGFAGARVVAGAVQGPRLQVPCVDVVPILEVAS